MNRKPIHAVEMVRAIRDALYDETRDLSRDELKAYIHREAAALRQEVQKCPPLDRGRGQAERVALADRLR